MSDLQKEILTILFDKGLLAIIIVILVFYFNKAIEKFRAEKIYSQKLAEYRIRSYQSLLSLTLENESDLSDFIHSLESFQSGKLKKSELDKVFNRMTESQQKHKMELYSSQIFISTELLSKIGKFIAISKTIMGSIDINKKNDNSLIEYEKQIREISLDIVQMIRLEIKNAVI